MQYDLRIIGRRMREARELRDRSLWWLAEKTGISEGYLSRIERGLIPTPGLQTMGDIARALGMTLGELIGEKDASPDELSRVFQALFGAADEAAAQAVVDELQTLEPEDHTWIMEMIAATIRHGRERRERLRRETRHLFPSQEEPIEEAGDDEGDGEGQPESTEGPDARLVLT